MTERKKYLSNDNNVVEFFLKKKIVCNKGFLLIQ